MNQETQCKLRDIQRVCHSNWEGGGVVKNMTKCDIGGGGMNQRVMLLFQKKYCFNNRIRMTLKVIITPLYLLFNVAFHVDNKFCVEYMHI